MRLGHFETLKPVCPRCRIERQVIAPLTLATILKQEDDHIIEGVLHCSDSACQLEYPIIDGIPIIVPYIRKYLSDNVYHINARDDLSETIESIIGDGVGPGTFIDATRQHLSSYAWDHYRDLDQNISLEDSQTSSIVSCLEAGLKLVNGVIQAPYIDIGCSVGRTSFELAAKYNELTLGIDLNFSMLRVAQRVLQKGTVSFPLRRVGIVYDRQEFQTEFNHSDKVDFWACDALALPFIEKTFGFVNALNVLDSVTSPHSLLGSIGYVLKPNGSAVIATPYDWSPAATPVETWIGGHSQRGPNHGAPEPMLKNLLSPGSLSQSIECLSIIGEIGNFPWEVRLHNRSHTIYKTHIIGVEAREN